jgi:hypothetical protein
MIRQVIDIYAKLLRGLLLLALGSGFLVGPTEKMKIAAKKSLARGLVKIPIVQK